MPFAPRALTDAERLDWLRLMRSENVGPITFFNLLHHFGSVADVLVAAPGLSVRGGRKRAIRIASAADAERKPQRWPSSAATETPTP